MEYKINQIEHEVLSILYNNGNPIERSLQRVLAHTDINGRERLHNYRGSEILFARKNLVRMGLVELIDAQRRHDLEEGDGYTRVGDDVTFYYSDLDKKLKLTETGVQWCQHHPAKS
ncbi:hypothetical protein [Mangrovibacterium sp.]|uniref:hypothetical protein n=1 Tax=Mangrovibacterium sp. TaxID=1961364 RepID=UPI00356725BA